MKKCLFVLFTSCMFLNSYSQITTNEQPSSCLIEIVNSVTGQSVYSGVLYDGLSVSTVGWIPGIYLVICKNGDNKKTQKITVK